MSGPKNLISDLMRRAMADHLVRLQDEAQSKINTVLWVVLAVLVAGYLFVFLPMLNLLSEESRQAKHLLHSIPYEGRYVVFNSSVLNERTSHYMHARGHANDGNGCVHPAQAHGRPT